MALLSWKGYARSKYWELWLGTGYFLILSSFWSYAPTGNRSGKPSSTSCLLAGDIPASVLFPWDTTFKWGLCCYKGAEHLACVLSPQINFILSLAWPSMSPVSCWYQKSFSSLIHSLMRYEFKTHIPRNFRGPSLRSSRVRYRKNSLKVPQFWLFKGAQIPQFKISAFKTFAEF